MRTEYERKRGEPIVISEVATTTSTVIYSVPIGFMLEIDSIEINKDGNAGTVTITDEGNYKDGTTPYSKVIHEQYFPANDYDDTREKRTRAMADIKAVTSAGNARVIIKGRLI